MLAARGLCNFDNGEEKISDDSAVQILRQKALGIYIKSFSIALAFTLIVYVTS